MLGFPKKFHVKPDPLEAEEHIEEMVPTDSYMKVHLIHWYETQIQRIKWDIDAAAQDRTKLAVLFAKMYAYQVKLEQLQNGDITKRLSSDYEREFGCWLQGKSAYNISPTKVGLSADERRKLANTPWGLKPLRGPSIVEYLHQFIDKKFEFERKLTHLKMVPPTDIVSAWLYFKYIVCPGVWLPDEFHKDFDWWMASGEKPAPPDEIREVAAQRDNPLVAGDPGGFCYLDEFDLGAESGFLETRARWDRSVRQTARKSEKDPQEKYEDAVEVEEDEEEPSTKKRRGSKYKYKYKNKSSVVNGDDSPSLQRFAENFGEIVNSAREVNDQTRQLLQPMMDQIRGAYVMMQGFQQQQDRDWGQFGQVTEALRANTLFISNLLETTGAANAAVVQASRDVLNDVRVNAGIQISREVSDMIRESNRLSQEFFGRSVDSLGVVVQRGDANTELFKKSVEDNRAFQTALLQKFSAQGPNQDYGLALAEFQRASAEEAKRVGDEMRRRADDLANIRVEMKKFEEANQQLRQRQTDLENARTAQNLEAANVKRSIADLQAQKARSDQDLAASRQQIEQLQLQLQQAQQQRNGETLDEQLRRAQDETRLQGALLRLQNENRQLLDMLAGLQNNMSQQQAQKELLEQQERQRQKEEQQVFIELQSSAVNYKGMISRAIEAAESLNITPNVSWEAFTPFVSSKHRGIQFSNTVEREQLFQRLGVNYFRLPFKIPKTAPSHEITTQEQKEVFFRRAFGEKQEWDMIMHLNREVEAQLTYQSNDLSGDWMTNWSLMMLQKLEDADPVMNEYLKAIKSDPVSFTKNMMKLLSVVHSENDRHAKEVIEDDRIRENPIGQVNFANDEAARRFVHTHMPANMRKAYNKLGGERAFENPADAGNSDGPVSQKQVDFLNNVRAQMSTMMTGREFVTELETIWQHMEGLLKESTFNNTNTAISEFKKIIYDNFESTALSLLPQMANLVNPNSQDPDRLKNLFNIPADPAVQGKMAASMLFKQPGETQTQYRTRHASFVHLTKEMVHFLRNQSDMHKKKIVAVPHSFANTLRTSRAASPEFQQLTGLANGPFAKSNGTYDFVAHTIAAVAEVIQHTLTRKGTLRDIEVERFVNSFKKGASNVFMTELVSYGLFHTLHAHGINMGMDTDQMLTTFLHENFPGMESHDLAWWIAELGAANSRDAALSSMQGIREEEDMNNLVHLLGRTAKLPDSVPQQRPPPPPQPQPVVEPEEEEEFFEPEEPEEPEFVPPQNQSHSHNQPPPPPPPPEEEEIEMGQVRETDPFTSLLHSTALAKGVKQLYTKQRSGETVGTIQGGEVARGVLSSLIRQYEKETPSLLAITKKELSRLERSNQSVATLSKITEVYSDLAGLKGVEKLKEILQYLSAPAHKTRFNENVQTKIQKLVVELERVKSRYTTVPYSFPK